ncbi:hypothetical protein TELCIR_06859 [Teladorsagia circumcincta]|uniref:Peptidase M13 C-terminal domain-containing protein n=1 Tax=Teladorsagia circumcincta TaxID=45464 RepID=A0A2G9UM03_TELCI|nr:hypothetical protein TELCIR_06859 [Teladorsagia circumcincta]
MVELGVLLSKAVLGKVDLIGWSLVDDDLFYNDSALDTLYAAVSCTVTDPGLPLLRRNVSKFFNPDFIGFIHQYSASQIGRLVDGYGKERNWWKEEWIKQYNEKADCYVKQYENVKAYRDYMAKQGGAEKVESVNGFTSDHLFFLGSALSWCRKTAEFTLYRDLSGGHSPSEYRGKSSPTHDRFWKLAPCKDKLVSPRDTNGDPVVQ